MLKNVLKQDQIRKITVLDDKTLGQEDFNKINRHQVQAKYGGSRPNMKNFWLFFINLGQFKLIPMFSKQMNQKWIGF